MFREEILENERRREIYDFIKESPGVHLRKLHRDLKMPLASLEYHLDYMVRKNIVFREKNGRYARYYVKQLEAENRKIISALRQKRMREILLFVLLSKKAKYQVLLKEIKIPPSTLSLYLKHLVDHELLTRHKIGRENIYTANNEERVEGILMSYKSSFTDRLVDKILNTWMDTKFRKGKKDEAP